MKPKVNFLIAGTQKGGTSALYEYLRIHPDIYMPDEKEIHYFDQDIYFPDEFVDATQYENIFETNGETAVGEATPSYMYWEHAPARIWKYNPDMKIIELKN